MGIPREWLLIISLSHSYPVSLTFPGERFGGWRSWQKLISRLTTVLALQLLPQMLYHVGLIIVIEGNLLLLTILTLEAHCSTLVMEPSFLHHLSFK